MSWLRGAGRTERETPGVRGEAAEPMAVRRPRLDLGALPPLQRSLGDQQLISDPAGFHGSLTTRRDTALTTPLGHLISADAPTGTVHGITTPVREARPAQSVQLAHAPVQRSLGPAVSVRPGYGGDSPSLVSASPVSPPPVSVDGSTAVAASESPVRRLVGERPVLPPEVPQTQRQPEPEAQAQPPVRAEVQRAAEPSRTPPAGRAPGLGLGAPLPALPPTAQRQAAATSAPGERPPARIEAEPEPEAVEVAAEAEPETAAVAAPLLGDDPLIPAPAPAPAPASAPAPAPQMPVPEPGPPVRLQTSRSPVPTQARVVPLLGNRPLPLQLTETERPRAAPPAPAAPVPVRWTPAGPGAAGTFVQRTAVPLGDTPPGPSPAPSPAPAPSSPSPPPVQRRRSPVAAGPPVPRSVRRSPPLSAGEVAVAAGVAQRMADGSVVFGAPARPAVRPVPMPVIVQRETETAEPPPPNPEPEPESGPGPGPGPETEPGPEPGPEQSAGAGPGASKAASPQVTDELVRALYAPLSRLFKADLRLERERAGFLINTRH
ncbi:hypothetical protein [Streptomyces inusitatus]|nr:hypothetical protein [Streptomyces inusitatus]